jgi:hypothetical protein
VATTAALALLLFNLFPQPSFTPLEQAFLANSADGLGQLFATEGAVQLSLPEPISFYDFISAGQARLLFSRVFSVSRTLEFYVDPRLTTFPGRPGGIIRARWSFRAARTGEERVMRLSFYVIPTIVRRGGRGFELGMRIVELRGESL